MRQYQVPQFIDIEDRIIGPLTLKQFLYLVAGAGVAVLAFYMLPLIISILVIIPAGALALSLAFLKINGVPFPKIMASYLNYATKPHLYIWKQTPVAPKAAAVPAQEKAGGFDKVPTLTESKLQDLAWSLDIKDKSE